MMSDLINNEEELISWFLSKPLCSKELNKTAFVSTKVRRMVMTGVNQGRVTIDGVVKMFAFTSVGGGVYKVITQRIL